MGSETNPLANGEMASPTMSESNRTSRHALDSMSTDSIKSDEYVKLNMVQFSEGDSDPLCLFEKKKTEEELKEIRPKKVMRFYQRQNDLIDELLAPIEDTSVAEEQHAFQVKVAIYLACTCNVVLLCLQVTAAMLSGSFGLFATAADAFMDVLSSAILLITSWIAGKKEFYRYPTGRGRFETVGLIVFGTLMATLSLQLIIQIAQSLFGTPDKPDLGIITIVLISIAIATKFCILMYCRRLFPDPTAAVIAHDCRNDLCMNTFGLILGILGQYVNPYIDPIGALVIAFLILVSYTKLVLEHGQLVAGKCADPSVIKRVTYLAMTHDPRILQVDTCKVYHAGNNLVAEVDIVLPPETTLRVSHDIGERLQEKLESLPNVERAFCHVDFNSTHDPEHRNRKRGI